MVTIEERARGATEEALELFSSAQPFEVMEEDRFTFQPIFPLAAHAMEQVKAALILIDAGLPYPAEVNARSAFQHAVTAQWVLLTAGGEQAALDEMKRTHSATIRDVAAAVELPPELLEVIDRGPTSNGPARLFWQMCDRFSEDKSLYVLFRRMSDAVHPSLRTLTYHLRTDDERGVFGLDLFSPAEPEPDLLLALALSAIFSVSAVESLRGEQPRMPAVLAIAAKWEVPPGLAPEDRQPELQRR